MNDYSHKQTAQIFAFVNLSDCLFLKVVFLSPVCLLCERESCSFLVGHYLGHLLNFASVLSLISSIKII